jgi:hypothetical protein
MQIRSANKSPIKMLKAIAIESIAYRPTIGAYGCLVLVAHVIAGLDVVAWGAKALNVSVVVRSALMQGDDVIGDR